MPSESGHSDSSVLELRQYKIVEGKRDIFVDLFEHNFVESQESDGMRLLGTFRDLDDPNRFTWLRQFPNMAAREKSLTAFYYGPVWKAHREEANPMLDDNDNVLLLHPASDNLKFAPTTNARSRIGETPSKAGLVVVTIYYLWKDPNEGFTQFFENKLRPVFIAAGMPVLGGYVVETTPNNFPKLPVRQNEKVFVWLTRVPNESAYRRAQLKLSSISNWRSGLGKELGAFEERRPQILRLAPTPRSELR